MQPARATGTSHLATFVAILLVARAGALAVVTASSPRLEEAVPILYLRGLSTGDFGPALSALLGEEALAGFSPTTVTRLLSIWQDEYKAWRKRSLAGKNYVYLWADGVHFNVRLEADRLACLTLVGVLLTVLFLGVLQLGLALHVRNTGG